MAFYSFEEIEKLCKKQEKSLWQAVLEQDACEQDISTEESLAAMKKVWDAMKESIESYDPDMISKSGLVGGEGGRMAEYVKKGNTFCGPFVSGVISRALMMGCSNACMRRIVAAPTAGACGVLPAVLYGCMESGTEEEEIIHALYVAAGVGQVIAQRAYISGAAGGCQAEIGSASGMAAAALTALRGGTPAQMGDACAMALKNLMGLVCDPVGGLVEVPCVKRNVIGAVNALSAADMALAGIKSTIPVDQVIDAMREVGDAMDNSLKETARGGLAVTPKAAALVESIQNVIR
ncbi:MAG: L-serine ammonia-lyase, iron-sulfur-dependent, subunit alpha [Blautia sp.]|nr:L-serine ammonia-lyase, iron-sulfur-dependent, subunit alpha [Blautia sp.]